jgi:signal recognition particle receptor subunit beta
MTNNEMTGTSAILYVIDSADRQRMTDACIELHGILKETELVDAVVLVYANKQDTPDAMSVEEITEGLQLSTLADKRKYHIQPCVATKGDGINDGLQWVIENTNVI